MGGAPFEFFALLHYYVFQSIRDDIHCKSRYYAFGYYFKMAAGFWPLTSHRWNSSSEIAPNNKHTKYKTVSITFLFKDEHQKEKRHYRSWWYHPYPSGRCKRSQFWIIVLNNPSLDTRVSEISDNSTIFVNSKVWITITFSAPVKEYLNAVFSNGLLKWRGVLNWLANYLSSTHKFKGFKSKSKYSQKPRKHTRLIKWNNGRIAND